MTTNQIRRDYTLILTVSATLVLLMPLRAKCSLPYAACGRQQRHDMPTHTAAVSPLSAYDQHRLIGDVLSGDHHTDPLPGPLSTSGSIDFDFEYRNRNAGTPHVRNRRSATVNDTRPDTVTIVNSSLHQPVASSNYHRQPKVVGGSLALDGEFPWAVSIRKYEQHHCGGVILNRHWILTAAHCVQSALSSQYTVRVGEYHLFLHDMHSADYQVSRIVLHPNYVGLADQRRRKHKNADIALMRTRLPIAFNEHVWPICYFRSTDEETRAMTVARPSVSDSSASFTTTPVDSIRTTNYEPLNSSTSPESSYEQSVTMTTPASASSSDLRHHHSGDWPSYFDTIDWHNCLAYEQSRDHVELETSESRQNANSSAPSSLSLSSSSSSSSSSASSSSASASSFDDHTTPKVIRFNSGNAHSMLPVKHDRSKSAPDTRAMPARFHTMPLSSTSAFAGSIATSSSSLATSSSSSSIGPRLAIVVGWGKRHEKSDHYSAHLQKSTLCLVPNSMCERWYRSAGRMMQIHDELLCAGWKHGGRDACHGDSGGPLLMQVAGRWHILGVVSTGIGCARPLLPGIYSRVSSFAHWIEQYALE